MLRLALRGVLAHKGRLVLTLVAVALGVAFVGGVLVLTDTMNRSFDDLFESAYEGTDAVVRSDQTLDQGMGQEQRADVDAGLLPTVEGADGVAAAEGQVQGSAQIVDKEGDALGGSGFGAPTFGGNWSDVEQLNAWRLRDGRAPRAAGEVVLNRGAARDTGYAVGDTVPIQTQTGLASYTLVGIATFGDSEADTAAGANYALFTTEQAQEALGRTGKFSAIEVVAVDGVSQDRLVDDLRPVVGDGVEVITGTEATHEAQSDLRSSLSFLTTFFLVFAVIAVVVGSFVIYNSFSIVVAQRTREMALLRAIGASRRQVRGEVLAEAIVVGVLGAVAGFVIGLGIAAGLVTLMDIDGSLAILPTAVATALLSGVLVTVTSALVPARRASKVPPVAAMRDVAVDTTGRSRLRLLAGVVLTLGGVAAVVVGATGTVALVGLGIGLVFVGLLLAGPGLAGPVSAAVGWPLARMRGVTGTLARTNAGRNPRRSASTAQALTIGIGIVAFFLVINSSVRASIDRVFEQTFGGDLIVSADSFGTVGLPTRVADVVGDLPEVEATAPVRGTPVEVDGSTESLTATSPTGFELFGLEASRGSVDLGDDQVVLLDDTAEDLGLGLGDTLDVTFLNTGTAHLTVSGIYEPNGPTDLGSYVVGLDTFSRHVPDATDQMVMVTLRSGESVPAAKSAIEDAIRPYGVATVQSIDDYKETIGSSLDVLLNLIIGLLLLAILIAGLGIANTIALSVFERTRELGLLRAVGMSRRQLRGTIRWESVIIALFGAVLGLAVGLLGGWGMVSALGDEGFEVFRIPAAALVLLVVAAGLLGMVAAVLPAWRAGRMNVLDAIHAE
jgi:putative ABC transport system permease protein